MKKIKSQLGFTMIELLIVITILGILAVAVLSAINPIEQINRGRDTGSQSDTEQLLSAIDRYNAFQGFYPWQTDADDLDTSLMATAYDEGGWTKADPEEEDGVPVPIVSNEDTEYPAAEWEDNGTEYSCPILARLSTGDDTVSETLCRGAQEIKESFVTRLNDPGTRTLYVYNSGQPGTSTYVCFIPQSGAFEVRASERCDNADDAVDLDDYGRGLPDDITPMAKAFICGREDTRIDFGVTGDVPMSCLP